MISRVVFILALFFALGSASALQEAIDNAEAGSIIRLNPGVYKGNLLITKPITIEGKAEGVIIDGGGEGTIITIKSSYVTLKNLTITNSGARHENLDCAVSIGDAKHCEVSDCTITDALFGIDMQMTNNSIIQNNYITSKDYDLGLRGDGLRLWYSNDNLIKGNSLIRSRDMVVWYSHGNIIEENYGEWCRYSLHFMYAGKNYVHNNSYKYNSVGIFFM